MINEVFPKNEVIEAIIKDVVIPIIKQLEVDLGKQMYEYSVYLGEDKIFSKIINSEGCECFSENGSFQC
ncbi:hypothetical protein [Acetivibrio straminisolvens]|uniref:hypothetical protein n=1 Tax=Acetivibrio straminisolvens TaxID=253314 RepID=UPI00223F174E|nr:hypothetical protein [Acetivibrio straminisolvens]